MKYFTISADLKFVKKNCTTRFFNKKFYTPKTRISGLFLSRMNLRICVNGQYKLFGPFFVLKFIWMCKISTVSEKSHTKCEITKFKGRSYAFTQNMQKMRCFLDKFTQLARILHDRRLRRSRQISTLHSRRKWDVKLQHNNISESPAPHNFVINLDRGSSFAFVFFWNLVSIGNML